MGYGVYILFGWLLLCVPLANTGSASVLDHLFTATSAVSTTGLATVGTSDTYTFLGQLIILLLIQLGGLGYMTFGSFAVLGRTGTLPNERRRIANVAFSLPDGLRVERFLLQVVGFTVAIEVLAAAGLYVRFSTLGVDNAAWQAIFHSVSAFCTAGFSLFDNGLMDVGHDPWVVAIISATSLSGALGFIVLGDLWSRAINGRRLGLTSRVILTFTVVTLTLTTWGLFAWEPTLAEGPLWSRWMHAFFQAMTALTTVGFNTIDIGGMHTASLPLLLVAMIFGASPSGTGGGLKSTTLAALWGIVRASLAGRHQVVFWGSRVGVHRLQAAVSAAVVYSFTIFAGTQLLVLTEVDVAFKDLLFEVCSAIGTVGISRGITGDLSAVGTLIVIGLMFIGRVGPLAVVLALSHLDDDAIHDDQDLAV